MDAESPAPGRVVGEEVLNNIMLKVLLIRNIFVSLLWMQRILKNGEYVDTGILTNVKGS